jgi:acyl carrier protein
MNGNDALRQLLIEFFELPVTTATSELKQSSVGKWDSLAMVRLITEMQSVFGVDFELDEIERLTSYAEIRAVLLSRNIAL